MMNVTNKEFLTAIFGDEYRLAHITSFSDDPGAIPEDRRMACWAGGRASPRKIRGLKATDNQYFTISLFGEDDEGIPRRRKALFDACFVIVVDDVAEKIPLENALLLPAPSYKLLSSAGSEQWGYILTEAEDRADVVNNLLDGLVAQGLAPDGKDPGMKGVTRYVRLPGGSNTKAKRFVDGKPFKCELIEWHPNNTHTMEALAEAFNIDLFAPRNEILHKSADTSGDVYKSHPIWAHVRVTGYNGEWTQVDCPNAEAHSTDDASGAAILVREDGGLAFKCHHGSCNGDIGARFTGVNLLDKLGIKDEVNTYINKVTLEGGKALADVLGQNILSADKNEHLPDYAVTRNDDEFNIARYIFIPTENKFYDVCSGCTVKPEALKSLYLREYSGKKGAPTALDKFHQERVSSLNIADGIGWIPWSIAAPKRSELIVDFDNKRLVNSWPGLTIKPKGGDITPWLTHLEYLIADERQREALLDYFAYMFQEPSKKPAYTILHRGGQGVGKDLLLKPLAQALGPVSSGSVKIEQLINNWGDYLAKKKFIIIEEVDKGQSKKSNNAIKTLLAPTATGVMNLNIKGGSLIVQRDCICFYMMSNKKNVISLEKDDRRYFVVDSFIQQREPDYYKSLDQWYEDGGTMAVIQHLLDRDLNEYNPQVLPFRTEGMEEATALGMYDYEIAIGELEVEQKGVFSLSLFTLTELKKSLRDEDIRCVNASLVEVMEQLGYHQQRGQKKKDGVNKRTPYFFVKDLEKMRPVEAFDYYEKYLNCAAVNS